MPRWRWRAHGQLGAQREHAEDLLRSLALLLEPDSLRASVAARVRELTGCDSVAFCSFRLENDAYQLEYTTSEHAVELILEGNGTLVRWLKTNQEAFLIPHPRGAFQYLDVRERQALTTMGVRGCVPVFSSVRLVAILLICSRRADWRLRERDLEWLLRLGRQAGLALENAELHMLERERLKNLHRAEQLAVAGQLAATVAHEIRNPLTAIRSTAQYVLDSAASWETKRGLLQETIGEVDRIERTVSGVLGLSRTSDVSMTDLDAVANLEESLFAIQAYARAHGVTFDRQLDVSPLPIRGDAGRLHQVWVNLFMNACQAMSGGGRLTVRSNVWQASSQSRPVALLQVRDTGPGISDEHLAQVFTPFFTTKDGGTGLGLPICLDIVTRHGGNLRLESTEGQGTSVTVLLPLRSL